MLELPEDLPLRAFRTEARYTAARLRALPETRPLADDFDEAHDKLALLEEETARLDLRRIELRAMVEIADDAWDDTIMAFQRRLLDVVDSDVDAPLYREYFADIPSHVTSLSYAAEVMISQELEAKLAVEEHPELRPFAGRLAEKRDTLEATLREQTRFEVDEARFHNREALAKAILNKLRRVLFASLEEMARMRGYSPTWRYRFFSGEHVAALDLETGREANQLGDGSGHRELAPPTGSPGDDAASGSAPAGEGG